MFDRIKAKEKSKYLLRGRSFLDFLGFAILGVAEKGVLILAIPALVMGIGALAATMYAVYLSSLSSGLFGIGMSGYVKGAWQITVLMLLAFLAIFAVCAGIVLAISLLVKAGMNRAALRMNRGDQKVRIIDLILAGDILARYVRIALWQALFLILWNLPALGASILALILLAASGSAAATATAVLLFFAAGIWSIYITLNKICQYYFAWQVAEDNRDLVALDCLRRSGELMAEHKWELFVTMLSFLGWNIVALLPFGSVFALPYQYLTYTSIYEQLTGSFQPIPQEKMLWLRNAPQSAGNRGESDERKVEILSGEFAGGMIPVKAGEEITIGRDPKRANVVTSPSNTAISGLHCRIRYDEERGRYIVIDHSSNGTYLNGEKMIPEKPAFAARGALVKLADGAMLLRLS